MGTNVWNGNLGKALVGLLAALVLVVGGLFFSNTYAAVTAGIEKNRQDIERKADTATVSTIREVQEVQYQAILREMTRLANEMVLLREDLNKRE